MIKYLVSDLINSAKQIADLENSSFISWNENIRLINEAYISLYQKLIDKNEGSFVETFFTTDKIVELPKDFWQLKKVCIWNNGNIIPVVRKSNSESYNSTYYEIKNNLLIIGGNYSGKFLIEYYKTPKALSYSPENIEIDLPATPTAAADKLYLLDDGSIYDIDENETVIESNELFTNTSPYIMTNSFLINKNRNTLNLNTAEIKESEEIKIVIGENVYTLNNTSNEIMKNNIPITEIDFDLHDERTAFVVMNKTFDDYYVIFKDGSLYHNDKLIENVLISNCKYEDGIFYFYDNNLGMAKIINDEVVILETDYEPLCINKIDFNSGYGFTTKSRKGYFVESFIQDTCLDFPNSFYFQLLSYILASYYKIKQGADNSQIVQKLQQMEQTFFDTLSTDAYTSTRISNVY